MSCLKYHLIFYPPKQSLLGFVLFCAISIFIPRSASAKDSKERIYEHSGVCETPTVIVTEAPARSVKIQLKGEGWLAIAEVEVFARRGNSLEIMNIALGKPARQSSTAESGVALASRAVDGNTSGDYGLGSVSHTNFEPSPWWEVDLGELVIAEEVRIWNRTDGVSERLANFRVVLSEASNANVSPELVGTDPPSTNLVPTKGTWGYLRLLVFGVSLLLVAWVCHMAWWSIRIPLNQNGALLRVFGLVFTIGIAAAWMFHNRLPWIHGLWEFVLVTLFYIPISLMYISLYSLIEERSPSLMLIDCLSCASPNGMDLNQLTAKMEKENDHLLERRLEIMERDGLILRKDGEAFLTPSGRRWANIFTIGAKIMGLQIGA